VKVSDHIVAGNNQIKELKDKVDLIVILINSDRKEHQKHPAEFPDADFIFVSGSNNRTRPHMPQKEGGPYLYSSGKQGKYMMVLDLDIKQYNTPIVDVSSHEEKIKSVNRRFERLQKKDPTKSLDELYKGQPKVKKLKMTLICYLLLILLY
jgi:2',3'-cyclic-nucleotide 2'-phosphodiesterase (5'-nucleotidase family)